MGDRVRPCRGGVVSVEVSGGGGGADVMSLNGPQGGVLGDGVVGEEAQAGGRDR